MERRKYENPLALVKKSRANASPARLSEFEPALRIVNTKGIWFSTPNRCGYFCLVKQMKQDTKQNVTFYSYSKQSLDRPAFPCGTFRFTTDEKNLKRFQGQISATDGAVLLDLKNL